jgi:hypothetical protein
MRLSIKATGAVPEKLRAMKLGPKSGGTIIFGVGAAAGFYAGKTLAGEANADAKALRDLDQPSGTSEGRGDRASNTNAWATQPVAQRQRVSH